MNAGHPPDFSAPVRQAEGAMIKSKRSRLQVYDKGILRIHPQICLNATDGHIDFRHFSGVRIRFLPEDEDIIIAPAVRFDEFHGLHKHFPWIHSKDLNRSRN